MKIRILERYPERIQARMEVFEDKMKGLKDRPVGGKGFALVVEDLKVWRIGTLRVSFKGGTTALHKKIADAANEWTKYANIRFDFGYSKKTKRYRRWTAGDTSHIRIGFDDEGYWSLVGTDSNDTNIIEPGEISMNFEGFAEGLPSDWKGTVLHEFGHALGFHHEHSTPDKACDFDWNKLYATLSGPPNFWSRRTVDHNLRQLPATGMTFSKHDPKSIMHYSFDEWMFLTGSQSPCYTKPNNTLSAGDKAMAAKAYPTSARAFRETDAQRKANLTELVAMAELPKEVKRVYKRHLDFLRRDKEYETLIKEL